MDVPLKCFFFFRDEGLHTDFACLMFRHLVNKPTKERILEVEFLSILLISLMTKMTKSFIYYFPPRATRRLCAML